MAVDRSRWLGIGMVDAGLVFRNETLVTGDDFKRFFLGVVEEGLNTALKEVRVMPLYYLIQRRSQKNVDEGSGFLVRYLAKLFQVVCNVGFSVKGDGMHGRQNIWRKTESKTKNNTS